MRTPDLLERGWPRPRPTPAQVRIDVAAGAVAALVCVAVVEVLRSAQDLDTGWAGVEAYLVSGAMGLLLAGRRLVPLSVLVVESVLFVVLGERLQQMAGSITIQMVLFAALYAAWAWSRHPRRLAVVTVVVLVAMFGWLTYSLLGEGVLPPGRFGLLDADTATFTYAVLINVIYFAGAIAWGQAAYRSARRLALIETQQDTERALVAREQSRALRDERLRIARDLHDVVAHHVSSIGVQAAGAGRVLERDPAVARGALATIEGSSRQAVTQMHELVGLLREDDGRDREPQEGVDRIASLAAPPVEYRVVGEPFPLPPTLSVSLYRIAQEAVTNMRRHARPRHGSVVVRYLTGAVEVEVLDDGHGSTTAESPPVGDSGGYGLRGIRERTALHGGEAEIGPRPQGGFRVRVRVPVR